MRGRKKKKTKKKKKTFRALLEAISTTFLTGSNLPPPNLAPFLPSQCRLSLPAPPSWRPPPACPRPRPPPPPCAVSRFGGAAAIARERKESSPTKERRLEKKNEKKTAALFFLSSSAEPPCLSRPFFAPSPLFINLITVWQAVDNK